MKLGFTHRSGIEILGTHGERVAEISAIGASAAPFARFNLAFHVGDDAQDVLVNREIFKREIGAKAIFMNQIHSDKICVVDDNFMHEYEAKFAGLSEISSDEILAICPQCDALVSDLRGVALCVMVADCAPVLICDEVQGAVAAVHAGRAGVCAKIASKTVRKMSELYGSSVRDLRMFVGAHIGAKCYEIGDMDLGWFNRYKNGQNFDIKLALRAEFAELGVGEVHFSDVCTHCDERFYSYRRDGKTGRFCGFIAI